MANPTIKAENHYLNNTKDAGALIMVSAAGILSSSDNKPAAERFKLKIVSTGWFGRQASQDAGNVRAGRVQRS